MNKHDFAKAIACFQKALDLDPGSEVANGNMAAALTASGRPEDGERSARRAVDADPSSAKTRYLLGLSLALLGRNAEEAIEHLRKSADKMPAAHIPLAHLLFRRGDRSGAQKELETDLASGDESGRDKAQRAG